MYKYRKFYTARFQSCTISIFISYYSLFSDFQIIFYISSMHLIKFLKIKYSILYIGCQVINKLPKSHRLAM